MENPDTTNPDTTNNNKPETRVGDTNLNFASEKFQKALVDDFLRNVEVRTEEGNKIIYNEVDNITLNEDGQFIITGSGKEEVVEKQANEVPGEAQKELEERRKEYELLGTASEKEDYLDNLAKEQTASYDSGDEKRGKELSVIIDALDSVEKVKNLETLKAHEIKSSIPDEHIKKVFDKLTKETQNEYIQKLDEDIDRFNKKIDDSDIDVKELDEIIESAEKPEEKKEAENKKIRELENKKDLQKLLQGTQKLKEKLLS